MPRVEFSASKGLFQETGSGFALNNILTITGDTTLDGTKTVVLINGDAHVTLPTDDNSNKGDVIIIVTIANGGGTPKIEATNTVGAAMSADIDAVGDFAICVYDGADWVVGKSQS